MRVSTVMKQNLTILPKMFLFWHADKKTLDYTKNREQFLSLVNFFFCDYSGRSFTSIKLHRNKPNCYSIVMGNNFTWFLYISTCPSTQTGYSMHCVIRQVFLFFPKFWKRSENLCTAKTYITVLSLQFCGTFSQFAVKVFHRLLFHDARFEMLRWHGLTFATRKLRDYATQHSAKEVRIDCRSLWLSYCTHWAPDTMGPMRTIAVRTIVPK